MIVKMSVVAKGIEIVAPVLQEEVKCISLETKRRRPRRWWTREWIKRRAKFDVCHNLLKEVKFADSQTYKNYLRLSPEKFSELLVLVAAFIKKQDTCFREALSSEIKL
ncbi:hypothetical protein NQ314_001191 [Rhamnusium bicolor]|uniref:Uncharacterized protein n=1 Tax=Rhamnusium bicolor TaxID=1586634 RepID=A0AAV8ZUP7_9CUCU|nr:hypothetical protein NQ314_001191 [Rhamnusium bicolor]